MIEIKNRWTGAVLYRSETAETMRQAVEEAVKAGADLSDANLRAADLSDANLSAANLSAANLSYADLSYANLSDANLSDADLSDANLSAANLSYADLRAADLSYADLRDANLRAADLSYADLRDADLRAADLSAANLRAADLRDANLSDAEKLYNALSITGLRWPVLVFFRRDMTAALQIGCQRHAVEEWAAFDDARIANMDGAALAFWTEWKAPLLALAKYSEH